MGWASQKKREVRADLGKDPIHFSTFFMFDWFSSAVQSDKLRFDVVLVYIF